MSIFKWILIAGLIILALGAAFYLIHVKPPLSIDEGSLPKFVKADFIDLNRVHRISKFRSGYGHDYSEPGEPCRSMKHYFQPRSQDPIDPATYTPKQPYINIYSPVDGNIASIQEEGFKVGKQIHISPDGFPAYTIRLFHVYPKAGLKWGSKVSAGEMIGTIGATQGTDISVEIQTLKGTRLASYFEVMPDSIFETYKKLGVKSRSDLIISKEYRDSHSLGCYGEKFTVMGSEGPENWAFLNQ